MKILFVVLVAALGKTTVAEEVKLDAGEADAVELIVNPDQTIYRERSTVEIQCVVNTGSRSLANISWLFDNQIIRNGPNVPIHIDLKEPVVDANVEGVIRQKLYYRPYSHKEDPHTITCLAEHEQWSEPIKASKTFIVHPWDNSHVWDEVRGEVSVWPKEATVQEGGNLTVLCLYHRNSQMCRIESTAPRLFYFSGRAEKKDNVEYYGLGSWAGECGAHITNIPAKWNGNVTCAFTLDYGSQTVEGIIPVTVTRAPDQPKLSIFPDFTIFRDGLEITAICEVPNCRPAANITWWIGDKQLTSSETPAINEDYYEKTLTVRQNLTYTLTSDDDGRALECRAEHELLTAPKVATINLTVLSSNGPTKMSSDKMRIIPKEATKRPGESLNILCQVGHPIKSCRFQIGNTIYRLHPNDTYDEIDDVVYYGNGLQNGECGAYLKKIHDDWRGVVSCILPSDSGSVEQSGDIPLTIPRIPSKLHLAPLSLTPPAFYYEGDEYKAECVAIGSYPVTNLSWTLNGNPILDDLDEPEITQDEHGLYTIRQTVTRNVTTEDEAIKLVCQAQHQEGYNSSAELNYEVYYSMYIDPDTALIAEYGTELKIMCSVLHPINKCVFKFKRGGSIVLKPDQGTDKNEFYYGKGFEAGECGIHIKEVQWKYDGISSCNVNIADSDIEVTGDINITVSSSFMGPVTLNILHADLRAGGELRAECVTFASRPVSEISWWLDDEQIFTGLEESTIETVEWNFQPNEYRRHQLMTMLLNETHYEKHLTCRAEQVAINETSVSSYRIDMTYPVEVEPPLPISRKVGDAVTLLCKVHYPIDSCRFIIGGVSYLLDEQIELTDNIVYHGNGLKSGECGLRGGVRADWFRGVACALPPPRGHREVLGHFAILDAARLET